ncbi:uncharacterized protein LOC123878188 [Maniola jurtina]|uniref:uncharacterized protein LOC123878188 n=1 Tax=Maniola jurtina TaxID=191418 RepID=UPI001E68A925|nr:uncharacterized protein LOC123878188 [Maniola jurtina]
MTIEELEKRKNELFKQINIAIDDSVKSLLQANDTEAALGLQYMHDLKEHIKELNATENYKEEKGIDVDSKSDLENRRYFKKGSKYYKEFKIKPKNGLFDFEAILKPGGITEKEWKKLVEDRKKMQEKLDLWILEREKERKKIKKAKEDKKRLMKSGKYEKCPRFGYHGKKKTDKTKKGDRNRSCKFNSGKDCPILDVTDESTESEEQRSWVTYKNKYPCCRKCCKKSYMGCL